MITDALSIAIILAVAFVLYLVLCWLLRDRDEDAINFNWQGTVPAGPGLCSCGAPHAKLAPFPGDPVPLPAPVAVAAPEYVREALGGHDDADGWVESRWRKIDGQMLAAQIRDGAL